MTAAAPLSIRPALVWVGAVLVSALLGVAVIQGGALGWALSGAVVVLVLFPLAAEMVFPALLGWIALAPVLYPFLRIPPFVTFDRIAVVFLFAAAVLHRRTVPEAPGSRRVTLTLIALTAAFGVRAATTEFSALATWVDALVLPALVFLLVSRYVTTEDRLMKVAAATAIAGAGLAIVGIAGRVFGFELASRAGGDLRVTSELGGQLVTRISGPYPAPEVYGVALITCLAATLFLLQRKPGWRTFAVACAVLEVGALGLTLFRAAWIAAILVVVTSFGLRPRRYGRVVGAAFIVGLLALAASAELRTNETFQNRIRNTDNIESRLATWAQGVDIWRTNPVTGVGINQYPEVAPTVPSRLVNGIPSIPYPHNSYIGILAETGLLGILPLIALTIAVWWLLRAYSRRAFSPTDTALVGSLIGATVGYLLMSLTLNMLPYGPSNAFLLVLLGMAAGRLNTLHRAHKDQTSGQSDASSLNTAPAPV